MQLHPDVDIHTRCTSVDPAEEAQAKGLADALDIIFHPRTEPKGEVAKRPGILDDPVWWLELAMERVEEGYDPFDDQAGYLSVLRKLRDDAWDCQMGRIDAMYEDYQAEAGER